MVTNEQLRIYWTESRRPLVSLWFVLPMLAAYELGLLMMPATIRNGADAWLRRLLDVLGFGGYFFLPCLTVGALLAWHHLSRQPWKIRRGVLTGMLGEAVAVGLLLVALARLQGIVLAAVLRSTAALRPALELGSGTADVAGQVIAYCGAGVYEELLFRLLLVPVAVWLAGLAGLSGWLRTAAAVTATSLLFSGAHYVGPGGDEWELYSFLFRFSAGVVFAALFVYRGFGITAASHALYDVLVGVWQL